MIVVEREMVVRVVEVGDVTDASILNTDLLIARYGMSHSHNMSLHERVCLVYCTFCSYSCSYFITYFHSCISCFICPYLFFIILVHRPENSPFVFSSNYFIYPLRCPLLNQLN